MNSTRLAFTTLSTTGLATAGLAAAVFSAMPAHAAPAGAEPAADRAADRAAVQSCTIQVGRVEALDLQEDGGATPTDEILIRVGDQSMVERTYVRGQVRNTLGDGDDVFVGRERVRLLERDGGALSVIDTAFVPCQAATRTTTLTDATGDAIYTLRWTVVVNP